jgi:hypothetical protein
MMARDQLEQLSQRSQRLSETIQSTCALAENVSSKVRELDETKVNGHVSWHNATFDCCLVIEPPLCHAATR